MLWRPVDACSRPALCARARLSCASVDKAWEGANHAHHPAICSGTGLTPCHICARTGLILPASASGLGSRRPHLHRDWAHRCHICTGTGLIPTRSSSGLGSPVPHLRRDWAHPDHICAGTGLTLAHICAGTGLTPMPHLRREWFHPCHICAETGLTPVPHLRQDWAVVQAGLLSATALLCAQAYWPVSPRPRLTFHPQANPGQMWHGVSPVPAQMWDGGEPRPGADVGRGEPSSVSAPPDL